MDLLAMEMNMVPVVTIWTAHIQGRALVALEHAQSREHPVRQKENIVEQLAMEITMVTVVTIWIAHFRTGKLDALEPAQVRNSKIILFIMPLK